MRAGCIVPRTFGERRRVWRITARVWVDRMEVEVIEPTIRLAKTASPLLRDGRRIVSPGAVSALGTSRAFRSVGGACDRPLAVGGSKGPGSASSRSSQVRL